MSIGLNTRPLATTLEEVLFQILSSFRSDLPTKTRLEQINLSTKLKAHDPAAIQALANRMPFGVILGTDDSLSIDNLSALFSGPNGRGTSIFRFYLRETPADAPKIPEETQTIHLPGGRPPEKIKS